MLLFFWILSVATLGIQTLYWLYFLYYKPNNTNPTNSNKKGVSIIICAKNEAQNLQQYLPKVLAQNYPIDLFEILIVNDNSTDNTNTIVQILQKNHSNLRLIDNDNQSLFPGKKSALDCGIRNASFDFLLLTDADCYPNSEGWLDKMTNSYDAQSIILGYGAYQSRTTLLNRFIRWETMHTFIQYSSYANFGNPYMSVGRNVAYPKKAYFTAIQNNEFLKTYVQIPSGDDDLLLQEMTKNYKIKIITTPEAHTISNVANNSQEWMKQKSRHLSTGKHYQPKAKYLLGLYAITHQILWIIYPIFAVYYCFVEGINNVWNYILPLGFTIRLILLNYTFSVYNKNLKTFKSNNFYISGDALWAVYNLIFAPYILFKNKNRWK